MADFEKPAVGSVTWQDLTVPNAEEIRDFYKAVVGWTEEPVDMKGYNDYSMKSPGLDQPAAGICHTRGANINLPPQWLIYITVENLDDSLEQCKNLGGKIIDGPRKMGDSRYCIIQDPAGAVCALFQY